MDMNNQRDTELQGVFLRDCFNTLPCRYKNLILELTFFAISLAQFSLDRVFSKTRPKYFIDDVDLIM